MKIVAVTGTNGSGKGTLVRFLEEFGFRHLSARALLLEEIERQGLKKDRVAMQTVGNSLRRAHGPDYVARELMKRAMESCSERVIIESVRCPGEVHFLKSHGAILLAVDDEVLLRYERIVKRAHSTDDVTLEDFVEQERLESIGGEEWDMNIPACIAEADYVFKDNGNIDSFKIKVQKWVDKNI